MIESGHKNWDIFENESLECINNTYESADKMLGGPKVFDKNETFANREKVTDENKSVGAGKGADSNYINNNYSTYTMKDGLLM